MTFILENTFQMLLFAGVVFVLLGAIMYKFPPKTINHFYGYRTTSSMKNQETWDFSQKFSSVLMIKMGAKFIALSFLKFFVTFNSEMMICTVVLLLGAGYLFVATEKAIQQKFPQK